MRIRPISPQLSCAIAATFILATLSSTTADAQCFATRTYTTTGTSDFAVPGTADFFETTILVRGAAITDDGALSFTSAEIRIDVDDIPSPSFPDPSAVTIYKRSTPGSGAFAEVSTSYNPTANEIIGAGITEFSEFALASDVALPVELSDFTGLVDGSEVTLSWRTESETDNAGFEVQQRSRQGVFEQISFVSGGGTRAEPRDYRFTVATSDRERMSSD